MTRDEAVNIGVGLVADRLARSIPPAYAGVAEVLLREAARAALEAFAPRTLEMTQGPSAVAVLELDRRG